MLTAHLRRLGSFDAMEMRFRAACMARLALDRTRSAVSPARWDRRNLGAVLSAAMPAAARDALARRDWHLAHRVLADHYTTRASVFPLHPGALPDLAAAIHREFPGAAIDAGARAAKILAGRYDVLGYADVPFGTPPDWHADPVNGARAPRRFWSAVPYLSPQCGDHKVIWEINRHQHWLTLGRSRLLNGDRACYAAFVRQLEHWLAQNPPLIGVNWASMLELAFRAMSWLWALHLFSPDARHDTAEDAPWLVDLLLALDRQLTHVQHNLSRYFSPNTHLTGEALALYVAGHVLPELAASSARVEIGRDILLAEIDRQVHGDGGHVELSPHYHRYTTDFYLLAFLVGRAAGDPAAARFGDTARRLSRYLRTIADDSGMLPLIGDDDGGQMFGVSGRLTSDASPTLATAAVALGDERLAAGQLAEEVLWLCGPEHATPATGPAPHFWSSAALSDSGYYVLRNGDGDQLVFDAGRHGFLNGGHAHADALSIVLNVRGTPLLVDPGTALYTIDRALRDRFRSTPMHNAVVLDGRPQAEPQGAFHWRSRVEARASVWQPDTRADYVEGSHNGYAPVRHTRAVLAIHGFGWLIVDHLLGDRRVSAEAFWHLHPDWSVAHLDGRTAALTHQSGTSTSLATTAAPLRVLAPGDPSGLALFAPVYGRIVETHVVTSQVSLDLPASFATFIAADPSAGRNLQIRVLRTSGVADGRWHTLGIEVSSEGGSATILSAVERDPAAEYAAAPRQPWGVDALRTDGRFAAVVRGGRTGTVTALIEGSLLEFGAQPPERPATLLEPITCVRS